MLTNMLAALLLAVPGLQPVSAAPSKGAPEPVSSQPAGDPEIVKVNGASIRQSQFQDKLLQDYGQVVMDNMINRLLLVQEAKARKIEADKAEVEKRMAAIRERFPNEEAFADYLKKTGATTDELRQDVGQQISIEKLVTQAKSLTVTDKEVKAAFDKNKDRLGSRPSVHLRMMQVKAKAEAEGLVETVKKGGDFSELVKEHSISPSKKLVPTGDYGFVPKGELPPEIDKIVFSMKVGETRAIQTKQGHHVLQVVEAKAAQPADFAKAQPYLRNAILGEKLQAAVPDFVKGLREKAEIEFLHPQKAN